MLAVMVAVMQVGIVRMAVRHPAVAMRMRMRLVSLPREAVPMLMVIIVRVRMRMLDRLVHVLMLVALREVQPHAERHERGGDPERS